MGYQLDEEAKAELQVRQKMNPAIRISTYDDLLTFVHSTIRFVKTLNADVVTTAQVGERQE